MIVIAVELLSSAQWPAGAALGIGDSNVGTAVSSSELCIGWLTYGSPMVNVGEPMVDPWSVEYMFFTNELCMRKHM